MRSLTPLPLVWAVFACAAVAQDAPPTSRPSAPRYDYPASWWEPVEADPKKGWEILPQAGTPGKVVILSKRNELGILSNFAATPFELDGVKYASLEGLWQSMKYPEGPDDPRATHPDVTWEHTRAEVAQMTGREAYGAGKKAKANMQAMGIDWLTYRGKRMRYKVAGPDDADAHYAIVYRASLAKVRQNPEVFDLLLRTGDLELRPDHEQGKDATAAYRYFEIYMKIRDLLREEAARKQ